MTTEELKEHKQYIYDLITEHIEEINDLMKQYNCGHNPVETLCMGPVHRNECLDCGYVWINEYATL